MQSAFFSGSDVQGVDHRGVLVLKYNTVGAKLLKWAAPDTADCIHARDVCARPGHTRTQCTNNGNGGKGAYKSKGKKCNGEKKNKCNGKRNP